jgi:hypothetical protein
MGATEMTTTVFETRTWPRVEKEGGGTFTHVRPPRRVKVVGYVRQSFEEMDRKRTSPEDQKGRIAACADTHDWHLVNTYEDTGWSGGDLDRPGLLGLSPASTEIVIVEGRTA